MINCRERSFQLPKLNCPQLSRVIDVNSKDPLMEQLIAAGIPVASSCGGDGICGKCAMRVFSSGPLPEASLLEKKTLEKNQTQPGERLSCQLYVSKNLMVETNYW